MLIKKGDNPEFLAGDLTHLKEVLHPKNSPLNFPFSLASAHIKVGHNSLPHTLKEAEIYYFLKGKGVLHLESRTYTVEEGDCFVVEPGKKQWLANTGDEELAFLCVVTPPWTAEGEQIFDE